MTKCSVTTLKLFPIKSGKNTVEEPGIHSIENHDKIATLDGGITIVFMLSI